MSKLFDLAGKVAIVTGSSRGIGKAAAEALAAHGAKVVISSRKQDACDEVAAAIDARHGAGTALAVAASISDKAALRHLVDAARRAFGRIDVLVCNAASNPYYGPLEGIADDQFRKILDNNVLSNHWLIQMVAPEMRARREGSIVIVSSIGGMRGSPVIGAYNVSKAADLQLARNYAVEFGPDNVRVNCIAPGLIRPTSPGRCGKIPSGPGRPTRPRRCGGSASPRRSPVPWYLASPASAFMTGQAMVIDGGVTI